MRTTQTADRVYLGHKTGLAFSNLLANASAQPISWALRKFRAIATSGNPANLAADCRETRFDSVERLLTSVTLCGRPTSTSRNHRRHLTRILVGVPNFPLAARKDRANRGHEAVWGGEKAVWDSTLFLTFYLSGGKLETSGAAKKFLYYV